MKQVTVLAPAKLNLTLDVTGILPGGYHALDMIMQAITLYERVTLHKSRDLRLRLPGSRVPPNEKNTAYKAALAFFHYTGLLAGVEMEVRKVTPVRAGMAGGSADAAAVLVGLNALYDAAEEGVKVVAGLHRGGRALCPAGRHLPGAGQGGPAAPPAPLPGLPLCGGDAQRGGEHPHRLCRLR